MERPREVVPRHRRPERSRGGPAGHPLVIRELRRLPRLHAGQPDRRAADGKDPLGYSRPGRAIRSGPVRGAAWMAAEERPLAWPEVHAERAARTRDGAAADRGAVDRLRAEEVRRPVRDQAGPDLGSDARSLRT